MTLSPKGKVLFEVAQNAATKSFSTSGKTKQEALHEWLCAEVMFADEVGINFVKEPEVPPQEHWQCQVYQTIAEALCQMRHHQYGSLHATAD